jgi:FkbM family methyltransferase
MFEILKPLYYEAAKHLYKLAFRPDYRQFAILESKLRKKPRFQDCRIELKDWSLKIPDSASFLSTYHEIFVQRIYAFESKSEVPKILDLGANIGLSVLFFKLLYPHAQITAFEADPNIFRYLEENIVGNGYKDVTLINEAAWNSNTTLTFEDEGADGGKIASKQDTNGTQVKAIDMGEYLKNNPVDFLKIDIEGAEDLVLNACQSSLTELSWIFVEYHSKANKKQSLDQILAILSRHGFRVHLHSVVCSPSPFVKCNVNAGFDLQLNIFGWKE